MGELKILFVDDDPKYNRVYTRGVKDFNKTSELIVQPEIINDYEIGLNAIENGDYDGAILDLKLSKTDKSKNGDVLARKIREGLCFPVRIYTAFPDLEEDPDKQNEFYKVYQRTDIKVKDVVKEIADIYRTGITGILGKRGIINNYLANIFWKHLSDSFNSWVKEAESSNDVEKILLRHILSHLQAYLDKDGAGGFDEYYPEETYIMSPINDNIHTGLILKRKADSQLFIVLTPFCDLAQGKADKIILAKIENKNMSYVKTLKRRRDNGDTPEKKKTAKEKLEKLLHNNLLLKYHCLPEVNGIGGFIDFQKINSYKKSEIDRLFQPVATVTDKFCKDIVARFSTYYSRQGQPNFENEKIYKIMYD